MAVDAVAVTGATSSTYTVVAADVNKTVTVEVTGQLAGYNGASASAETDAVVKGDLTKGIVTISGTAKVGVVLTATPGTWAPTGVSFTYQWLRNGTDIAGATSATYTPVSADQRKTLSVAVTGALTGYSSASSTSLGNIRRGSGTGGNHSHRGYRPLRNGNRDLTGVRAWSGSSGLRGKRDVLCRCAECRPGCGPPRRTAAADDANCVAGYGEGGDPATEASPHRHCRWYGSGCRQRGGTTGIDRWCNGHASERLGSL